MFRHCGTCGTDFDDSSYLSMCPHLVVCRERPKNVNPAEDSINELVADEIMELWSQEYQLLVPFHSEES